MVGRRVGYVVCLFVAVVVWTNIDPKIELEGSYVDVLILRKYRCHTLAQQASSRLIKQAVA